MSKGTVAAVTRAGSAQQSGERVAAAFQSVLGWRWKADDPEGLATALKQSFDLRDVEGHTEPQWHRRDHRAFVKGSALSGAQLDIQTRAERLLTGLTAVEAIQPLEADDDPGETAARRTLLRQKCQELSDELARASGPRRQQVGRLIAEVANAHATLRPRLRLLRRNVVNEDDAAVFSQFESYLEDIRALQGGWIALRQFMVRVPGTPFRGIGLQFMSERFQAVTEAIDPVKEALAAVQLGEAELGLEFVRVRCTPLSFAGLLDWIEEYCAHEGPASLKEGGRIDRRGMAARLFDMQIGVTGIINRLNVIRPVPPVPLGDLDNAFDRAGFAIRDLLTRLVDAENHANTL